MMPETTDTRAAAPNIQDGFLNSARRDRVVVRIRMMDGTDVEGRIKNFDRFALVIDHEGADHMVFKHAISTIRSNRSVPNYFSSATHEA